ncbi:dynein regulatory complex subunit 7 [Pelobates cultripes]|uniref:Dynein regulatory complex subunit 7 n=1 Tax=Pelobates cultripes TaxID=61616 RepID=A0AAD1TJQ8_PELCU|nr:dynein regulatory complex subunit 7 [Pelobates cultripes]
MWIYPSIDRLLFPDTFYALLVKQEAEKPVSDPLYGRRIHCWVLVLSGKCEVPENLFIDSFTGKSFDTKDDHFLGIESVWNHENYWVNMQDCRNGCKVLGTDITTRTACDNGRGGVVYMKTQ